jgi:two-component system chemotaxis sensor kinase CheA
VDEILGKRQVVLKSLEGLLENFSMFSGGALLGDGRVGLVLDIPALVKDPVLSHLEGVAS